MMMRVLWCVGARLPGRLSDCQSEYAR